MKLLHLSIVSIILCALGLLVLLVVTVHSANQLLSRQHEIADLIDLKESIDDFSVASDSLLLFETDPPLWQAFVADARIIQTRLDQYGARFPDALKASHRMDEIIATIDAVRAQSLASADATRHEGLGPLKISPRSTHILNKIATSGVALDTALDDVLVERQQAAARAETRIVATLSISTLAFGVLCVSAFLLIHRRLARPARAFIDTVNRLREGDMTARAQVSGTDELAEMATAFNRMLDQRESLDLALQGKQSELERKEKMLSESERIAHLGSWRLDFSANLLEWSEETYRIAGVSPESFLPSVEAFFDFVHPDDMGKLEAVRNLAIEGKDSHDVVFRIIRPNGEVRHVHERAVTSFDDEGNPLIFSGTIQDITERRQLDARLLQFSQLVESSNDICFIYDDQYRIVYVNRAYSEFLGMSLQEIEGRLIPDVLGEDLFREKIEPGLRAAFAGQPQRLESTREHPQLGTRYMFVSYLPIASGSQNNYVGGVITDITPLKLAQHRLTQQNLLLDMAGRVARLGGWSVDLVSGDITWSNMVAEIHDKPHGHSPSLEEAIGYYSVGDRERITSLLNRCAEQGQDFDDVFEITTEKGRRVWVRSVGEAVYDDNGNITGVRGAFQDVTERQGFIQKLEQQASELRLAHGEIERTLSLRQSLINSLPAHIALLDEDSNIIDVNEQWRHFGRENAYQGNDFGVGTNYIRLCESSRGDCAEEANELAEGLRSVLAGREDIYALEYPCHAPNEERWFRVMANRVVSESGDASLGAVVMHIDITSRKQAEMVMSRLAYEDLLTGLLSRNGFIDKVGDYIEDHGWDDQGIVLHLDIINMHDINEAHGYTAGNELFGQIGARLQSVTEAEVIVGRPGGDEFIVYLPNTTGSTREMIFDRFDAIFARPFAFTEVDIVINILARIGYTVLGDDRRDVDTLLREAELALFHCRYEGTGNHWSGYTREIGDTTNQRVTITRELHRALQNDEFELHFQPKVDMQNGNVIACEALIRWEHPEQGMLSPGLFIPIAEQSQLIRPIGDWVMNEACRYLRKWTDEGLDLVWISINVSMIQVIADDFVDKVKAALSNHGISPEMMTLEITESVFENHTNQLRSKLNRLHEMGLRTSLDDFGTGYSSLRYLQQFHFDEIKIDQGFVMKMLEEPYSYRIVETIFGIASALNAGVVAEGIEDADVADALLKLGCRVGQGYYYSPPMAAEDFRWLIKHHQNLPLDGDKADS